jgi:tetratricopeptide (TPR) repeat protein
MTSQRKALLIFSATAVLLIAASLNPAKARAATAGDVTYGHDACTSSERWTFSGSVFEDKRDAFISSLKGRVAPVRGFSEALALRRFAPNAETKWLGEYWISRALFDSKLAHIAFGGFASIAGRPVSPSTAGIQLSAVECLLELQGKYPSLELPTAVLERFTSLKAEAATPRMREVIYRAAATAIEAYLNQNTKLNARKPDPKIEEMMTLLKGAGVYEDFAMGLRASRESDHGTAVAALDRFLTASKVPAPLKRFSNSAHLLMARSLYSLKQFDRAAQHLRQVTKHSNELASALEELSWAQLQGDHLPDAIGTAMTLQAGGLRHTFAPEAPMVMAMALNELCQYPESVRAIQMFRKNYEKSYQWLQTGLAANQNNLYGLAIKYIRKTPGLAVPDRVAGEWIRSPLFISSQEELNLLFDEKESTVALGKSGSKEQSKLADALVIKAKDLPKRLRAAKAKMNEGDHLPSLLLADMLALKEMIIHYRRLQQGAPVWHTILDNYRKTVPVTQKRLLSAVNSDLKGKSIRMLSQLEEIAENIQLIEVEIYNGASQDIIWKNAHPDYQKVAASLLDERRKEKAANTWDWGRSPSSMEDDGAEVWEDELGSFSANLYDNCESKDKFLALKMGR